MLSSLPPSLPSSLSSSCHDLKQRPPPPFPSSVDKNERGNNRCPFLSHALYHSPELISEMTHPDVPPLTKERRTESSDAIPSASNSIGDGESSCEEETNRTATHFTVLKPTEGVDVLGAFYSTSRSASPDPLFAPSCFPSTKTESLGASSASVSESIGMLMWAVTPCESMWIDPVHASQETSLKLFDKC